MGLIVFVIIWICIWVPLHLSWGLENGVWACAVSAGAATVVNGILTAIFKGIAAIVQPQSAAKVRAERNFQTPGASDDPDEWEDTGVFMARFSRCFIEAYCTLALIDGPITKPEYQLILEGLQAADLYTGEDAILDWDDLAEKHARPRVDAVFNLIEACGVFDDEDGEPLLSELLDLFVELALADGRLNKAERELLEQYQLALGVTSPKYEAYVLTDHRQGEQKKNKKSGCKGHSPVDKSDLSEYADILGVPTDANRNTILAAYRELVRQNHPDKVAHMGRKIREAAESEMKRINEAKDALLTALGN